MRLTLSAFKDDWMRFILYKLTGGNVELQMTY